MVLPLPTLHPIAEALPQADSQHQLFNDCCADSAQRFDGFEDLNLPDFPNFCLVSY